MNVDDDAERGVLRRDDIELDGAHGLNGEPPVPPAYRRGDDRRVAVARPDLCDYCQRHPRRAASAGGGPRPRYCETVWSQDHRGRDVTCGRLDEAHDLWQAVYGGTGPLAQLDIAAQVRHLAEFGAVLDPVLAALTPMRGDLDGLRELLAGEVTDAHTRAERLATEADQARRDKADGDRARQEEIQARERAEADRNEALESVGRALADKYDAEVKERAAEDREREANTRAATATQTAETAVVELRTANTTIAEQAERIGELTGANEQLTARVNNLNGEVTRLSGQIDQQRGEAATAARAAGEQLDEATGRITQLTGELAGASTRAEQATAAAERNQAAADELAGLRTRLLTALATPAAGDEQPAALRAHLIHLINNQDPGPGDGPVS